MTNTLDPQVCFAEQGLGIACVPEIAVRQQLEQGRLVTVLDDHNREHMIFHVLWPSSRQLSPRIRVFVDFIAQHLFPLSDALEQPIRSGQRCAPAM
ncbi:LysR substrate binding domain protein [compost metagenome]